MISILFLSNQKDTFSEIKSALRNNYKIYLANSTAKLNDVLVSDTINIVIIDAAFLKTTTQKEITESLSFFPELTIIAAVESGETENLVNLFQNFEIYRYLQKPFTAEQVKKCIEAAARKYSKGKNAISTLRYDADSSENKKNSYIYLIPITLSLLIIFLFIFNQNENSPPIDSDMSVKTIEQSKNSIQVNNDSDLLTLDHEPINLSAKTIPANELEFTNTKDLINKATEAEIKKELLFARKRKRITLLLARIKY